MAEIVAAFGVPHTPNFPALVAREGPNCETALLYAEIARHLEAVQPDLIVVFDSDHLNTFFLDNLPTFAVGIAEKVVGPNDRTAMPTYTVPVDGTFATHLFAQGIGAGFDLSLLQDFTIDHSILVPLHFLTPRMNVPIVPVFVNGLVPPLPLAKRCSSLGEMVRDTVKRLARQPARRDPRVRLVFAGDRRPAHQARRALRYPRSRLGQARAGPHAAWAASTTCSTRPPRTACWLPATSVANC